MEGLLVPGCPTNHIFQAPPVTLVLAATSYTLWLKSPGRKAHIRSIRWFSALAGTLTIGFTSLAAAFVPAYHVLDMLAGLAGEEIFNWPGPGNTIDGFAADATAITGSLGNIILQASVAGSVVSAEIAEL